MKMKKGFTLIELLVVVLIIGILSSVALPSYQKAVEKARVAEVETVMADLRRGYKMWKLKQPKKNRFAATPSGGGSAVLQHYDLFVGMPSLQDIMEAGGFTYPVSNGAIVTQNFTVHPTGAAYRYDIFGGCTGDFAASRKDSSYSVFFSSSEPVSKCCQGSTEKGKSLCKSLGAGWSVGEGMRLEILEDGTLHALDREINTNNFMEYNP